jgi:hypothetical protein
MQCLVVEQYCKKGAGGIGDVSPVFIAVIAGGDENHTDFDFSGQSNKESMVCMDF